MGVVFKSGAKVEKFRQSLSPLEKSHFDQCLKEIGSDPGVDDIHKSVFRYVPPIIIHVYRDDEFVINYLWTKSENTSGSYDFNIDLISAIRTNDTLNGFIKDL